MKTKSLKQVHLKIRTVALFIISFNLLYSQQTEAYFGQMKKSEYPIAPCPVDSTVAAYYLMDYGASSFVPDESGWKLTFERHFRIKIDGSPGVKERKITLWLHDKKEEGREELESFRSVIYNLEANKWKSIRFNPSFKNGKLQQSINETEFIHEVHSDPEWKRIEIFLPNVKVGSVIEVYYKIKSDLFFEFRPWQFVKNIPVLDSRYVTSIPEYFQYTPIISNEHLVHKVIDINTRSYYSFKDLTTIYTYKNIPAFTLLPYVNNINNFLPKVEMEFIGYSGGTRPQSFAKSWDGISKELLRDTAFGGQIRNCTCFDSITRMLNASSLTAIEKLKAAFDFVQLQIKWNGDIGIKAEIPIDSAFKYQWGSAAEINLGFVCLLNKIGISANPVLASTREHGYIYRSFPSLKWFDYTLVNAAMEEKHLFIDVADSLGSISFLQPDLVNGFGKIIDTSESKWVELLPQGLHQIISNYEIELDPTKGAKGIYSSTEYQYAAYEKKKSINRYTSTKEYINAHNLSHPFISLYDAGIETTPRETDLHTKGTVLISSPIKKLDSLFYWIPEFYEKLASSPFITDNRSLPIEFPYPILQSINFIIKIPDDYKIFSYPKSIRFTHNENTRYTYLTEVKDNTIKINMQLYLKRLVFGAEEYSGIKLFFQHMVDKQMEPIVLKKS